MGEKKFYICKHCGNMIGMIKSSGVNVVCCGDPMTELKPNTVEASQEKHLPVVTIEDNIVKVKVEGARPLIFDDVVIRVSPKFATYMHIDYDEANACGFSKGIRGRIIKD